MNSIAQNSQKATAILLISAGVFFYWMMSHSINVYAYPVIGAVYEMTALLVVAATYALPVVILLLAMANKFKINIRYYLGLGILVLTILLMLTVYNG